MKQIIIDSKDSIIDRLRKRGYKVKIIEFTTDEVSSYNPFDHINQIAEDSIILENMLKNLKTEPMARLQKQLGKERNTSVRPLLFVQGNEDFKKNHTKTEDKK